MRAHESHLAFPRWRNFVSVLLLFLAAQGCVSSPPHPNLASAISSATGYAETIRFRDSGMPLDEASVEPSVLTLGEATRAALLSDPEIQAALARVRGAEADCEQARLLPNPILSVSIMPRFGPETALINPALSEDLVAILERPRRADAADQRLRAATADVLTAVLNTLAAVQQQYADVQAFDAEVAILQERRTLLGRLLDLARLRLSAGEGIALDVTTIQAELLNLETDLAQKKIDQNVSRLTLARIIGRPSGRSDWAVTQWESPPDVASPQQAWIASALMHRPEVESDRWALTALGDEAYLARFAPWDGSNVGVEAERDVIWAVGPSVSTPVPIFDSGQAKQRKAQAAVIEARHKLTQVRRQVVEDVRKAYDTYIATKAVMTNARTQLMPVQTKRLQQAEDAYRAGESDITTVLVAEQDLQDTKAKLVDLEQKTSATFIQLQRAAGGPGPAADLGLRKLAVPATTQASAASGAPGTSTEKMAKIATKVTR